MAEMEVITRRQLVLNEAQLQTPIIPHIEGGPQVDADGKLVPKDYINRAMEIIAQQEEIPSNALQLLAQEAQYHGYGEILTESNVPAEVKQIFPPRVQEALAENLSVSIDYVGNVVIGRSEIVYQASHRRNH